MTTFNHHGVTQQKAAVFRARKEKRKVGAERNRSAEKIDFEALNEQALQQFASVIDWLGLEGEWRGKEFTAFNPERQDNNLGSFNINSETGKWCDFAEDDAKGGDLTSLVAYIRHLPQPRDAAFALAEFLNTRQEGGQASARSRPPQQDPDEGWTRLRVVPPDAPRIPTKFGSLGFPAHCYTYRAENGQVVGHILRFDPPGQKKDIRPLTLWSHPEHGLKWKLKGFGDSLILYNLDRLHSLPGAPVLVVEGEKAAEAAKSLFPDYVVTTTMHGAKSVEKADLSPLFGRDVTIWPDNDEPGVAYANYIASVLVSAERPGKVQILTPLTFTATTDEIGKPLLTPGFVCPEKWDAADAVECGWTANHIVLLPPEAFEEVETVEPTEDEVVVGNYTLKDGSIYLGFPRFPGHYRKLLQACSN